MRVGQSLLYYDHKGPGGREGGKVCRRVYGLRSSAVDFCVELLVNALFSCVSERFSVYFSTREC